MKAGDETNPADEVVVPMPSGIDPSPVHEGYIDRSRLVALFTDLELLVELVATRRKRVSQGYSDVSDRPPSLNLCREDLLSGAAHAVQLVYRYQGSLWCDTLMRAGDGFRIVRIALV